MVTQVLCGLAQPHARSAPPRPPPYVEKVFRKYLECGVFARGFARVGCDDCGDHYLVCAFSCKGRGVSPSCNTRRMAEAASHMCHHVFTRLPVRQWELFVPKRIRYYLQREKGAFKAALRIFLRVVQQSLVAACPGAAKADPAHLHLGAVAFIHRFSSSLNTHVHFNVCVVDGVFEGLPGPASITFHSAQIDDAAITQLQAAVQVSVRKRVLRAFVVRGHLESHDAKDIAAHAHGGGFSVDARVCFEATDRPHLRGFPLISPDCGGRCASLRSVPTLTRFWSTQGWSPRPRVLHRRADQRCEAMMVRKARRSRVM